MKGIFIKALLFGTALAASTGFGLAADKTVLTMWHSHPEWKKAVDALIAKYQQENPNIEIQLTEIPSQSVQAQLNTALAAGEGPDLFSLMLGTSVPAAAEAGQIADLTGKVDISHLTHAAQDAASIDGKVWAVPVFGSYTVALFYQKKDFEAAGVTPPTNATEFLAVCEALKAKGITPMISPGQDGILPAFMYMMMTSSILGEDGQLALRQGTRKLTDPDLIPAAKFLQDIYPCFQNGSLGTAYTEGKALFALGKGAMIAGGSADYSGFLQTNPKVDVGVVPFPAVDGGTPSTATGMQDAFNVNAKSPHQEEAIKFLQWLIEPEAAQMVADTITLSNVVGISPQNSPVMAEMVEASHSNDARVWYEFPETSGVWGAAQQQTAALFLKELTPEQFAEKLQAEIKPSGAQ